MKKIVMSFLSLLLLSLPVFAQSSAASTSGSPGAGGQSADMTVKKEAEKKSKKEAAPKSDDEIQKCIAGKLANSEKLKPQGFNATVSNSEATLTGNALNAGSKGAATRIAQSCGAKSVKNNIASPGIPRPKKSEEKKN